MKLALLSAFCICLLIAPAVTAGPIVTWQAIGTIGSSNARGSSQGPPVGTPFTVTFSFDPTATTPTANAFDPRCVQTSLVSGTLTLGNSTYNGLSGVGFTHGRLPASTCDSRQSTSTQFLLFGSYPAPTVDSPWDLRQSGPLFLDYVDEFTRDAFPNSPAPVFPALMGFGDFRSLWTVGGNATLSAVQQPSPVPEPGTMTLFGIGLAAIARRVRRRANQCVMP